MLVVARSRRNAARGGRGRRADDRGIIAACSAIGTTRGERLAAAVHGRVTGHAVVLAIPRGGVIVARARRRGARRAARRRRPAQARRARATPSSAIGAVAPGVRVVDERLVARARRRRRLPRATRSRAQEAEIARRTRAYRGDRPAAGARGPRPSSWSTTASRPAPPRWRPSDGRAPQGAARVVFAAPVGPAEALRAARATSATMRHPGDAGDRSARWGSGTTRSTRSPTRGARGAGADAREGRRDRARRRLFGALGIRSLVYWIRRPFESRDPRRPCAVRGVRDRPGRDLVVARGSSRSRRSSTTRTASAPRRAARSPTTFRAGSTGTRHGVRRARGAPVASRGFFLGRRAHRTIGTASRDDRVTNLRPSARATLGRSRRTVLQGGHGDAPAGPE